MACHRCKESQRILDQPLPAWAYGKNVRFRDRERARDHLIIHGKIPARGFDVMRWTTDKTEDPRRKPRRHHSLTKAPRSGMNGR